MSFYITLKWIIYLIFNIGQEHEGQLHVRTMLLYPIDSIRPSQFLSIA